MLYLRPFSKITKIGVVYLFISLGLSGIITVNSVYMNSFLHSDAIVGFIFSLTRFFGLLLYFIAVPLLEKYNKSSILSASLLVGAIAAFLIGVIPNAWIYVLLLFLTEAMAVLRIISLGTLVRNLSNIKNIGKDKSLSYVFSNTAWLVGPILAGYIAAFISNGSVFIYSAILYFISFILLNEFGIKPKEKHDGNVHKNIISNISSFLKKEGMIPLYIITGGIYVWWFLIYTLVPLFIQSAGLDETVIGYFFFLVIIPALLLEYPFGKIVDKKQNYRSFFRVGYIILAISALFAGISGNIYLSLLFLIFGSIGTSMIEPLSDAYFFKIVKKKEQDRFYAPYCSCVHLFSFLGGTLMSTILLKYSQKEVFFIIAVIMILLSISSFKIKTFSKSRMRR